MPALDELVVPEAQELTTLIASIKQASPDMGVAKVHATIKEQRPNWQVSQDRVKKIVSESVTLDANGKPKKLVAKEDHKKKVMEEKRKATEAAMAKRKADLKNVEWIPTKLC